MLEVISHHYQCWFVMFLSKKSQRHSGFGIRIQGYGGAKKLGHKQPSFWLSLLMLEAIPQHYKCWFGIFLAKGVWEVEYYFLCGRGGLLLLLLLLEPPPQIWSPTTINLGHPSRCLGMTPQYFQCWLTQTFSWLWGVPKAWLQWPSILAIAPHVRRGLLAMLVLVCSVLAETLSRSRVDWTFTYEYIYLFFFIGEFVFVINLLPSKCWMDCFFCFFKF